MIRKKIIFAFVLMLIAVSLLSAQGENLTLKIAVMGQGDEIYFWFGHIGLIIQDSVTGRSSFYDYGLFSFDDDNFYLNFAFGRLLYSCGVSSLERNLLNYIRRNRDIKIYTLDVSPATAEKTLIFAENNIRPENRDYYYHHFKDNCSTRIRDIIDIITDGQFSEQFKNTQGRLTLREHVRRHTWFSPFWNWFLSFLMGQVIDTPITVWDEMFLPAEVGNRIENFIYTGENGERRRLVSSVQQVYRAPGRNVILQTPGTQWIRNLIFSFVLSVIFGFFFVLQGKKYYAGRLLSGISMSITGLFFGIAGLMLYFLNIFTDHDYTYQNFNMIFCTPLILASAPLGLQYVFTKKAESQKRCEKYLRYLWGFTAFSIIVSILLNLLPQIYQKNLADQMLMLPIALIFFLQFSGLQFITEKIFKKKISDEKFFSRKKHETI